MYIENNQIRIYISFWLSVMFWFISIMIAIGGLTRLTDSGLSITEWQLFSGFIPPLSNSDWNIYFNLYKEIPEYKIQNFDMTIKEFKFIFWWEWIHRFLGRLIGILFLIPLIFFSFKLGFKKIIKLHIIFLLICFQGFMGWYMVSSGLVDKIDVSHFRLSIHLIIAFIILSLILWNYLEIKNISLPNKKINFFIPIFFLILIFSQIILGAFVSGMDAGKIYNTWPLMGSSYFPNDSYINDIFTISSFNDPSLVQFMHRNLAYIIFVFYLFILVKTYRDNLDKYFLSVKLIGFFLTIQIILGILTLVYGAQIVLASMHQICSIFLVSSSVYLLYLNSKFN